VLVSNRGYPVADASGASPNKRSLTNTFCTWFAIGVVALVGGTFALVVLFVRGLRNLWRRVAR